MSGLLGCEFLDVFHFLPQPPKHPTTDKDTVPLSAAASVTPLNAVIKTDPKVLEEKQQARAETVQKQKAKQATKEAEKLQKKAAKLEQKYVETKEKEKETQQDDETSFLMMKPSSLATSFINTLNDHNVDPSDQDEAHRSEGSWREHDRKTRKKSATSRGQDGWPWGNGSGILEGGWVNWIEDDDETEALSKKSAAGSPAKGVSEEEISVDELPGVYSELSDEGQKLVQAQMKNMKHVAKICCGATLMVLTGIRLYFLWTTLSWALNKCISFDVLEDAPDQFDALMDAADNGNIGAADLQLDIEDNTPLNAAPSL
ncbi:hypothetical protein GNI_140080 [Gregarina niphandrodes]|uniref:Uncharacterized protein n=1 Tax=Gregarina niphandrodes TaxID=110365 RepID=A0A023B0B6_GRENI|nr:hypothetical protein GNI_140080 [Gregarina niphandrodes]EZG45214.1 hypothetical protein GNI_140080 [Gregarina niphandrodes]|eukprot:XP_011132541.1 hypothetical protein GNI_140080 [Gregarina niphandrodes]